MARAVAVVLSLVILAANCSADLDSQKGLNPPNSLASLLLSISPFKHRSRLDFVSAPRSHVIAAAGFGPATQTPNPKSSQREKSLNPEPSQRKDSSDVFIKWANGFSQTDLSVVEFDGIRGVSAAKKIESGEQVLKVPRLVALEVNNLSPCPKWCDKEVWKKSKWDARMAMELSYLNSADGKQSPEYQVLSAWLAQLPQRFDTPIANSKVLAGLRSMKYTALTQAVDIQRKEWNKARKRAQTTGIAMEDFEWAMSVVRSRAFAGDFKLGNFIQFLGQLFLVLTIALGYEIWNGGAGAAEAAFNGFAAYLVYALSSEFVVPRFLGNKLDQHVLCPIIDMFNHDSKLGGSEVSYDYFSNSFTLRTDPQAKAVESGSELKISYGPRTNDVLLQYYGFVEANNPYDVYKIDFPNFLLRMNKALGIAEDEAAIKQAAMTLANTDFGFELDNNFAIAFTADGVDEFGMRLARLLSNPGLAQKDAGANKLGGDAEAKAMGALIEIAKDAKEDLEQGLREVSGDNSASKVLRAFAAEKQRVLNASIAALS